MHAYPPDEAFRMERNGSFPTLDSTMLAHNLRDSASGNLLDTAIAMVAANSASATAGGQAKPPPAAARLRPSASESTIQRGTSQQALSSSAKQMSCALCKCVEASGDPPWRPKGVKKLPADLCIGCAVLCNECFAKAACDGRRCTLRGLQFKCALNASILSSFTMHTAAFLLG